MRKRDLLRGIKDFIWKEEKRERRKIFLVQILSEEKKLFKILRKVLK